MAEFEERVKNLPSVSAASELATEILDAQDYDRIEIALRYPRTANYVARKYAALPASEFKDRLTIDLIARPWDSSPEYEGHTRPPITEETFKPYADYMRARLGEDFERMGSVDNLLKPEASPEERGAVARRFKAALVKTGVVEGKATRPPKDWRPGSGSGKDGAADGSSGESAGGGSTPWIIGGAVLVVGAAGFVLFRKKAA